MKIRQALILVGGFGTRLRPVSLVIPKPLIPIIDKPLLKYHIDNFRKNGIRELIFCISYQAKMIEAAIKKLNPGMRFFFVEEKTPLGTGGAIKNAEKYLDERFIAINGDVVTDFDLPELLRTYQRAGTEMLIATREVENPSKFGLLKINRKRRIEKFLEKPSYEQDYEPGLKEINAGLYILSGKRIRDFGLRSFSIERDFFPQVLTDNAEILAYPVRSYWNDVGTSEEYLKTSFYLLNKLKKTLYKGSGVKLGRGVRFVNNNIILGPAVISENAELDNSIILGNVRIGPDTKLKNCVVSPGARIGKFVFLAGMVLGGGCIIDDYTFLNRSLL